MKLSEIIKFTRGKYILLFGLCINFSILCWSQPNYTYDDFELIGRYVQYTSGEYYVTNPKVLKPDNFYTTEFTVDVVLDANVYDTDNHSYSAVNYHNEFFEAIQGWNSSGSLIRLNGTLSHTRPK